MTSFQNPMRIGVIHIYNFPYGLAPTTRITAYCKGLVTRGHHVDIYSYKPQIKESSYPLSGVCDGGNYYHFTRVPKWRIPLITGWMLILYNIFTLIVHIKKEHRIKPYDAFILSFDEPLPLGLFSYFLQRLKNIKVVAIADNALSFSSANSCRAVSSFWTEASAPPLPFSMLLPINLLLSALTAASPVI